MSETPTNTTHLSERDRQMLVSEKELQSKPKEEQEFEIAIAQKRTPEWDDAILLDLEGDETPDQIRELLREKLPGYCWWLNPEWKEKGVPIETVEFTFKSGRKVELYNWFRALADEELGEINEAVALLATIYDGGVTNTLRYILVDDNYGKTLVTRAPQNGYGKIAGYFNKFNGISLNPPAFKGIHRAAQLSNLKGTVIHEGTHHIVTAHSSLLNQWEQRFGWYETDEEKVEARNSRCVTDYAKTKSDEDVCDSVVARVGGNSALDLEKAMLLDELILSKRVEDSIIDVKKVSGADVRMPNLSEPIYYRPQGFKIKIKIRDS